MKPTTRTWTSRAAISLLLASGTVVSGCSGTQTPEPAFGLEARCEGEHHPDRIRDRRACHQLAKDRLAAGAPFESTEPPLRFACSKYGAACTDLGVLYLEGKVTPQDLPKAMSQFGSGCTGRDSGSCAWEAVLGLARPDLTPPKRWYDARMLYQSCRREDAVGWACTNFGIAMSCGLFGANDLVQGRQALSKACRLGDARGCDWWMKMKDDTTLVPPCDVISGDPDHPVDVKLDLTPMAWGAEEESPFE